MDPRDPDVPSASRRVRLAIAKNRIADHGLQVALHRMEEERQRASQGLQIQRLKLLDEIPSSTGHRTPDNEEPVRLHRGALSKLTGERHPGRLLPSREGMAGPPKVHFEEECHGKSDTQESVKVEGLLPGPQLGIRRRYTMGMTKSDILNKINCAKQGRRRSVSMNDAELRGMLARQKPIPEETQLAESRLDNTKLAARPHSAMASSLADSGRSRSLDLHDIFKTAKRNGVLEPISPRHGGTNGCPSMAASHQQGASNRAYAKRHSEPHLTFSSRVMLPVSPLSVDSGDNYSSFNSSDGSDTSPEEDENQFPLQPYSIGNLRVRDSKGSFEKKTGKGGLRAWTGLPNASPKLKNRRVLHQH